MCELDIAGSPMAAATEVETEYIACTGTSDSVGLTQSFFNYFFTKTIGSIYILDFLFI